MFGRIAVVSLLDRELAARALLMWAMLSVLWIAVWAVWRGLAMILRPAQSAHYLRGKGVSMTPPVRLCLRLPPSQ